MSPEDADHNAAIVGIKKELNVLFAAQSEALHDAVYVGMSRNELKKYDDRLDQIKKLVSQLARLFKRGTN